MIARGFTFPLSVRLKISVPFLLLTVTLMLVGWLIGRLNQLYIQITGTNRLAPMRPTWLKSLRDTPAAPGTTTVVEAVLMGSVLLAALCLTLWFFFLAGSPIPNQ